MFLNEYQIKSIAVGAINIENRNDGYHFFKCTEKQIAAWYAIRNDMGVRAETTTGVRLDFITNSSIVEFCVQGGKFELLLNGLLNRQEIINDKFTKIRLELDGNENRITLLFPSHSVGLLKSVYINDDSLFKPIEFERNILFLGDSITQGWNSVYDSMSFAYRVSEYYKANSIINGIGGAIYHPTTFENISFNPDIIIVAYGTNDFGYNHTIDELGSNVSRYLELVKETYKNKKIFVILPIWRKNELVPKEMGSFFDCRKKIEDICLENNLQTIDGYDLVPHIDSFYDDAVHPNDLGFLIYAQRLISKIDVLL